MRIHDRTSHIGYTYKSTWAESDSNFRMSGYESQFCWHKLSFSLPNVAADSLYIFVIVDIEDFSKLDHVCKCSSNLSIRVSFYRS